MNSYSNEDIDRDQRAICEVNAAGYTVRDGRGEGWLLWKDGRYVGRFASCLGLLEWVRMRQTV